MTIRSELIELQQKAGGFLQVEAAVDWAEKHKTSALHQSLEWDNDKAGHDWRCHQVRRLIAIHVVSEEGVRQMVSLTIDRVEGGYRDLKTVMAVPDLRTILLQDALAELERMQQKYETITELAKVWEEAERVRKGPRRKQSRHSINQRSDAKTSRAKQAQQSRA